MYRILHLPTGTYMYYTLDNGKINTQNFYSQYEVDNNLYDTNSSDGLLQSSFKDKSMARRFLDRWERMNKLENNDGIDPLVFDECCSYSFNKLHFSVVKEIKNG